MQRAIEATDRRGLVQDAATRRLVRSVVNPCQLGQMGETHLLVEDHWRSRFAQSHARDGGGAMTVGQLRKWIDLPNPMGLPLELQNLIILSFAALTNRRFILRGGPVVTLPLNRVVFNPTITRPFCAVPRASVVQTALD